MRLTKIRNVATITALAAVLPFTAIGAAHAIAANETATLAVDEQDYADKELKSRDWSKAEAALLGQEFSEEDQVFAKLNLAFVYSTTGRKDLAVAIYNEILAAKENPYALTRSGQPRRVKTIAKIALARLDQ